MKVRDLSAIETVRSMRGRVPWPVAGKIFQREGLGRGQGWERTIQRVEEDEDGEFAETEEELERALKEHLFSGEKVVRLYNLDGDDLQSFREEISELEIDRGEFAQNYPNLVNSERLPALQNDGVRLIALEVEDDGTALVFGSVRYLTTREIFERGDMPDAVVEELGEFDELVAVRLERHEAVDVLWIPDNGSTIELRADYPFGTPFQKGKAALDAIEAVVQGLVSIDPFADQVNLFPVVQGLYDGNGDGVLVELAFMVSGSAQKLERTRRGRICCREEAYHLAGKAGLADPIEPYSVAVLWPRPVTRDIRSYPEVSLRGTSLMTGQDNPFLGEMIVRNCVGVEDFNHVIDRVKSYL